jgi:hypothetical protein
LNKAGGPSAVAWLIITVYVVPLYRSAIRAMAHIGKEILE